jgi:UPF0716 protein FxsA
MRFFIIAAILLVFPALEIWLLIDLAQKYGWLLLAYLLVVGVLGWQLIQEEKLAFTGRMMQTLTQGTSLPGAVFSSLKNLIAGVLLILPGVITDVLAVILLLIPSAKANKTASPFDQHYQAPANDDVIEGEYKRED